MEVQQGEKVRKLHIPTLEDRIVERAIGLVLAPLTEPHFHQNSFGFRKGRAIVHAIRRLSDMVGEGPESRPVLGKLDISSAFDRAPHGRMLELVHNLTRDKELTNLIERIVKRRGWRNSQGKKDIGLPQGGPLSPILFNTYLNHIMDQVLGRKYPEIWWIRWADDILIAGRNIEEINSNIGIIKSLLLPAGFKVNPEKEQIADLHKNGKIKYLGFQITKQPNRRIEINLTKEAILSLFNQLGMDFSQRPQANYSGRKEFFRQQFLFTFGSWVEAYAGTQDLLLHWPCWRKLIKRTVLGEEPNLKLWSDQVITPLHIECPSDRELNELYDGARVRWERRFNETLPISYDFSRRGAHHPKVEALRAEPDLIADGADLVPAPLVIIPPCLDGKPNSDHVDFRARFLGDPEPDRSKDPKETRRNIKAELKMFPPGPPG